MLFTADVLLRHHPESQRKHRRLRELPALLGAFCQAASLRSRLDALETLMRWLSVPDGSIPLAPDEAPGQTLPGAHLWRRLSVCLSVVERNPAAQAAVLAAFGEMLSETDGIALLAETGLANDRGIYAETADRLFRRLLPAPRDEHDLSRLALRLFPSVREAAWIEDMPPDLFGRMSLALGTAAPASPWKALLVAAADSFCLVAVRAQALGLSEEMRLRSRPVPLRTSPYYRLAQSSGALLAVLSQPAGASLSAERQWRADVADCRDEIRSVYEHLETAGVSVDVVYGLDVIEQCLARMELVVACLVTQPGPERAVAVHRLLGTVLRARLAERSLRTLAHANLRLLARKIIERAGETGEHYIATTRAEYRRMLASAAGGGLLTAFTAALKVGITLQHFPLFVEGFLSGANYATSFVVMQILGLTLATKMPAMTAATLAGALRDSTGPAGMDALVSQVARICRSQLGAAAGNITTVSVVALGLDAVWRWRYGHALLQTEKSWSVVEALHPLKSLTMLYASITGVILWLSSLAAGWIENWAVYHRLPQAIAEHRLGRFLGEGTMHRLSRFFARNISTFGGSVSLGFMLGMAPVLGQFFGLPIDVRHVTLSTGTLMLAAAAHGPGFLREAAFVWALLGIGTIFVCNLGVSFLMALTVALRARDVPGRARLPILRAILRRAVRNPGEFLFPPRGQGPAGLPADRPAGE